MLCWNPQTSEIIGELPPANNWAFQVEWCPRNPDLLATAFFDGTIGVHSLQSTNEAAAPASVLPQDGADVFDAPGFGQSGQTNLSLKQPPKWLRRPVSSSFGYGGRLVTISNLPSAQGRHQSSVVYLRTVVTERAVIDRANKFQEAVATGTLSEFTEQRSKETTSNDEENESWRALLSLFRANSRDELVTLFGFSKAGIAAKVAETIKKYKTDTAITAEPEQDVVEGTPHEPVVSFVEPEKDTEPTPDGSESPELPQSAGPVASETTPSEFSMSATSDGTKAADIESTTTEPSLFGDDVVIGTPQTDAGADFFSSVGTIRGPLPGHVLVPHTNYAHDSSVAATVGSRASSIASEALKSNTFAIYPKDTSEMDRLVTKALVLGDFESAVSLCLAENRFADAILLAVKGGPELLQKTQKVYFERQTTTLPYLRLYQSIVTNDLADIVQNADLREWQEIFVVLCTFANQDEFPSLAEQLGQRLQFQGSLVNASAVNNVEDMAREFRKHATLCYLAATKLEKIVNIWVDEMKEEEDALQRCTETLPKDASRYTTHAQALQTFIEKVTVFRSATSYVDIDLTQKTDDADAKTYKLATLYERYFEYADLLASQGLISHAVKYLECTPPDYKGSQSSEVEFDAARQRLLLAANVTATPKPSASQPLATAPATTSATSYAHASYPTHPYGPIQTQNVQQHPAQAASAYGGTYNQPATSNARPPSVNPYAPPQASVAQPQQPYQPNVPPSVYAPTHNAYGPGAPSFSNPGSVQQGIVPPPISGSGAGGPGMHPPPPRQVGPPPRKKENGGWNDAPSVSERRHTPSQPSLGNKPNPLTAPFPNAPAPAPGGPPSPYLHGQQPQVLPPPPRAGAATPQRSLGPPPQRGASFQATAQRPPGPPGPQGPYPPPSAQGRALPPTQFPPPPSRMLSPPQGQIRPGAAGSGQLPPPPNRVVSPPQNGPPRPMSGVPPFAGPPPPSGLVRATPPPQNGPYAPQVRATPPPQQHIPGHGPGHGPAPGPYGPQAAPRPGPPGMQGPPPGPPSQRHPSAGPGVAGNVVPQAAPTSPPKSPPKAAAPTSKYRMSFNTIRSHLFPHRLFEFLVSSAPGDRTHIPEFSKPAYDVLSEELKRMRQLSPVGTSTSCFYFFPQPSTSFTASAKTRS